MEYYYSTSHRDYPEDIYSDDILSNTDVLKLAKSFDWSKELKKEYEYLDATLAFINSEDKHILRFLGTGEKRLEGFEVLLLVPSSENFKIDIYKEKDFWNNWLNYRKKYDYFDAEFSIEESTELLNLYVNQDYSSLKSQIENRNPECHNDGITKFTDSHSWFMDHIVTRFLGILVASFFTAIAYSMIITFEEFNIVLLIFVGLSIVFVGGVILHEIKLLRNFIRKIFN